MEKICIPLRSDFKIDHTALKPEFFDLRLTDKLLYERLPVFQDRLREFIAANGGCLLICGHNGVGKTTLINGVIGKFRSDSKLRVIGITINLARPIDPVRLKYKILERLAQEFPNIQELKFALDRTKYQIKEIVSDENATSVEAGIGIDATVASKANTQNKSIRGVERSLHPYDDLEVERDIVLGLEIIQRKYATAPIWVRLGKNISDKIIGFGMKSYEFIWGARQLKVVVILDELDKLDKAHSGQVVTLVESLKNIFTETNMSFILVSGHKTLSEFLSAQNEEIESSFRNVISGEEYIPCLWDEIKSLMYCVVDEEKIPVGNREWYRADLRDYVIYASRGNLRRFVRVLTSYKKGLALEFDKWELARITKLANLQRFIERKIFTDAKKQNHDEFEIDNRLLETYRLVDYIIHLKPGVELTVSGNQFSHEGSWLHNHKKLDHSAKYDVKLEIILDILTNLGYLSTQSELNNSTRNTETSPKTEPVVQGQSQKYKVTEKVNDLQISKLDGQESPVVTGKNKNLYKELLGGVLLRGEDVQILISSECPYCRAEISHKDDVIQCKSCRAYHHLECWSNYQGCTTLGCIYNYYFK